MSEWHDVFAHAIHFVPAGFSFTGHIPSNPHPRSYVFVPVPRSIELSVGRVIGKKTFPTLIIQSCFTSDAGLHHMWEKSRLKNPGSHQCKLGETAH